MSPLEFLYRATDAGNWTAIHTRCGTESIPYPAKSTAREWAAGHECPEPPEGDAA